MMNKSDTSVAVRLARTSSTTAGIERLLAQVSFLQIKIDLNDTELSELRDAYKSLRNILGTYPQTVTDTDQQKIANLIHPLWSIIQNKRENDLAKATCNELVKSLAVIIWFLLLNKSFITVLCQLFPKPANKIDDEFQEYSPQLTNFSRIHNGCMSKGEADYKHFNLAEFASMVLKFTTLEVDKIDERLETSYLENCLSFLAFLGLELGEASHVVTTFREAINLEITTENEFDSKLATRATTALIEYISTSERNAQLVYLIMSDSVTYLKKMNEHLINDEVAQSFNFGKRVLISSLSLSEFLLSPFLSLGIERFTQKKHAEFNFSSTLVPAENHNFKAKNSLSLIFQFLLSILDQHVEVNYLQKPETVNNIMICQVELIKLISSSTKKRQVYEEFNKLNAKISMCVLLINLNYLIQFNLGRIFEKYEVPGLISDKFDHFKLPPVANFSLFMHENSDSEDFEVSKLAKRKQVFLNLQTCMDFNLYILMNVIEDEVHTISAMNDFSTTEINLKLVFNLIDLTFSSLFAGLIFIKTMNIKGGAECTIAEILIYLTYGKLIHLDTGVTQPSLSWIGLIDFAHDVCYADIRYFSIFENIFDHVITEGEEIALKDKLVKSGLQLFFSTFSHGECNIPFVKALINVDHQQDTTLITIPINEIKFLYADVLSHSDSNEPTPYQINSVPNIDQVSPLSGLVQTNQRSNYIVNSARQQSVHVDQFGK